MAGWLVPDTWPTIGVLHSRIGSSRCGSSGPYPVWVCYPRNRASDGACQSRRACRLRTSTPVLSYACARSVSTSSGVSSSGLSVIEYMKISRPTRLPSRLLHSLKILSYGNALPLALGIHEVDYHDLVFDQIIVESHFLAFVSSQLEVGKVASL